MLTGSAIEALTRSVINEHKGDAAKFARNDDDKKIAVADAGDVEPFGVLARSGTAYQNTFAAAALTALATRDDIRHDDREADGIEPLVALMRSGSHKLKDFTVGALLDLGF